MAHYAKVADGKVVKVIVAEADFFDNFVDDSPGTWIQTSYNTKGGVHYGQDGNPDGGVALRKNFAGIGFTYDATRDAFIPPQPYPSWTLNTETCIWEAPNPMPTDLTEEEYDAGTRYVWNEDNQTWNKEILWQS